MLSCTPGTSPQLLEGGIKHRVYLPVIIVVIDMKNINIRAHERNPKCQDGFRVIRKESMPTSSEEVVAYADELRYHTDEEWDETLSFDHPDEIWGETDKMRIRNVQELVEAD